MRKGSGRSAIAELTTQTDDVPVHLKSDAQRARAVQQRRAMQQSRAGHPREQAGRLVPSREFH
ncbi:hypothetical protein SIAM614_03975 [Roseibium aggregatum IAM 12614]|uniref:Uncharacterized protein n=1 Tax=Roseibium aggregatum (strain ATCC 25650 / DSM 13394 / JCM 20685 / NBRC 16684 / NCIMB 2208 / IAM 12614 / B1) TaxID=384765 RepID=A0NRV8_ROSAI|nr:hypothetical protein SIAM614_03975 [Roseibium aggregatum IAM 12614]